MQQEEAGGPDGGSSSSFGTILGLGAAGAGLYGAYYLGVQGTRSLYTKMLEKFEANKLSSTRKADFLKQFPEEKDTCDLLDKIATSQIKKATQAPASTLSTSTSNISQNITPSTSTDQQIIDEVVEYVDWLFNGQKQNFVPTHITFQTLLDARFQNSIQTACAKKCDQVKTPPAAECDRAEFEQKLADATAEIENLKASQTPSPTVQATIPPAQPKSSVAPPKAVQSKAYLEWVHSSSIKPADFTQPTGLVYHTLAFRKELIDSFKEKILTPLLEKCQDFEQRNNLNHLRKYTVKTLPSVKNQNDIVKAYFEKALPMQPDSVSVTLNKHKNFTAMATKDWLQLLCSIIDDIEATRQNSFL